MWISKLKLFIINILFPKACINCKKEGDYLCQDCQTFFDILPTHNTYRTDNLKDLYFTTTYSSPLSKKLIQNFKYEPFVKDLADPLALLILNHFQLIEKHQDFSGYILIPVPLGKKRLKWRGFNQSEEIGKKLAEFLKIPLFNNVLLKTKETPIQVELGGRERKENLREVFAIKNEGLINGRKILLIDDVYTTGTTMEECARALKTAGAKEVTGVVVARAKPEEDKV